MTIDFKSLDLYRNTVKIKELIDSIEREYRYSNIHVVTKKILKKCWWWLWNQTIVKLSSEIALSIWDQWNEYRRKYYNFLHYYFPEKYTDADPFKTILVDSKQIQFRYNFSNKKYLNKSDFKKPGVIQSGDWDKNIVKITNRGIYDALYKRFECGVSWEEIDYINKVIESVNDGERKWGCNNEKEIRQKCKRMDKLYESILVNGCVSQRTLIKDNKEVFPLEDPLVIIGRDGELIHFHDGNHRLCISKLTGSNITVRIGARHLEWQSIRNEFKEIDDFHNLSNRAKEHVNHPDIQDLLSMESDMN